MEYVHHAEGDGDEEEEGEGDVVDEGGGVHEQVELGHAEDAEQQTNQIDGDVAKYLNQEKIDEKLKNFIICLEPFIHLTLFSFVTTRQNLNKFILHSLLQKFSILSLEPRVESRGGFCIITFYNFYISVRP